MPVGDNSRGGSEVIGCSVRGQKSVDKGVPCQDGNAKRALAGNRYIIVAADGLGSASRSHVGSDTAAQAVADYLEDAVAGLGPLDEGTLLPMLREAFVHAREQLHRKAESLGESVSALNTTLLVAVGGPNGVGGAAVGDGGVVLHRGGQTGLVIPREETEYENETIPLQSDNWDQSYRSGWVADADAAAVFSDGLDGVAWSGPASVSDELFDQVFNSLREYSDFDELETFLEEFLDGESLRRSSRDDKTLVVGTIPVTLWTDPAEAAPIDNPSITPPETGASGPNPGPAQGERSVTAGSQPTGERLNDVRGEQTATSGRLGRNPNRRRRRIVGLAGIGVVVLVGVLAATLFLGSSGNSVDGIDVSTAELQGAEGLIVNGTVNGTQNAVLTVSVREGEDNKTPLISERKQVNGSDFSLQLSPDDLETEKKEFDYYGETEYEVVVEAADGTNGTVRLERGELRLAFTGQNVTVTDSKIRGSGTLTQGGEPVHEEAKPEVTYGAGSGLDVEYYSSNTTFQFSGVGDPSPGTDIRATFADRTETVTTAEFEVTSLTLSDEQIFEGDSIPVGYKIENTGDIEAIKNITFEVDSVSEGERLVSVENTGEESGTQDIDLKITDGQESLKMNSTEVTLNGSESKNVSLEVETETGDAGEYTATVSSDNGTATTELSVLEPANFTVDIESTNSPVVEGDDLQVTAIIENTGELNDTQTLQLDVPDLGSTDLSVSLDSGESSSETFSINTSSGDTGDYTAQVVSDDDTASTDVRVNAPANFTVNITSVDIEGTEGSTVTVSYEVTNTGDVQGTQAIEFVVNGTTEDNESDVILNGSETFSSNFSYDTMEGDTPAVNVTVSSDSDSATETVPVQGSGEQGGDDSEDDAQTLSASNEGTIVVANTVSHGRQAGTTATESSGRHDRGQVWRPGDGSTSVDTGWA